MKRFVISAAVLAVFSLKAQAQGPISYWQFNEASGTAIADSVGSANGSISGSVQRIAGAAGQGNALGFTNDNSQVANVGNVSATTGVTIEALIRSNWTGASFDYDEIFRKQNNGLMLLSFQNDNNLYGTTSPAPITSPQGPVLSFGLTLGGVYNELDVPLDGLSGRPTLASLANNQWQYVAATYDSVTGVKQVAINGQIVYSTTVTPGTLITSTLAPAVIGNYAGVEPFNGGIDEVAFYGRALSATEIAQHYNNVQNGQNYFATSAASAPEPSALALLVVPVIGFVAARRSRKTSRR